MTLLFSRKRKRTPEEQLHYALCVKKTLRSVRRVLSTKGINPADLANHRYPDGTTPLHLSLKTGKVKIFQYLLDQGADPRACLRRGHLPSAAIAGGDSSSPGDDKNKKGESDSKTNKGGDKNNSNNPVVPSICVSVQSGTLVPTLCAAAETGDTAMVSACIAAGCDLSSRVTPGGQTAVHIAAALADTPTVLTLLDAGCSASARDERSNMPVDVTTDYAVKRILSDRMAGSGGSPGRLAARTRRRNPASPSPLARGSQQRANRVNVPSNLQHGSIVSPLTLLGTDTGDIPSAGGGGGQQQQQQRNGNFNADVKLGPEGESLVAQLESMGYGRDDAEYVVLQTKAEGGKVDESSLGDLIDAIASLDVIRKDIQREDDGGDDDNNDEGNENNGEGNENGNDGYYEYFIHTVTEQHYVTFVTAENERYYIDEKPGNREWKPFPQEWIGEGMFVECDDDPAQIDPFEFDQSAFDNINPEDIGEEGDALDPDVKLKECYQMFHRHSDGEQIMTCLVDDRIRYYADPIQDKWIPFPEDWVSLGDFTDIGTDANNNDGKDATNDDDDEEEEGEEEEEEEDDGELITRRSAKEGGEEGNIEADAAAPEGVHYSVFVRADGTRHDICMVDGSLYLVNPEDSNDWKMFPQEWQEEKGARFEPRAEDINPVRRTKSEENAALRRESLLNLYAQDPSQTIY